MSQSQQRIIGITGGIGTGKSTVATYLTNTHKLPILDADIYARDAVQIDTPIWQAISDRYGSKICTSDRSLDRKQLGQIIFNHPDERAWLEQQIHPYVRQRIQTGIKVLFPQTVVIVVPLLFEANMTDLCTEIWVVYCSPEMQIRRVMERDQITQEQSLARINSQMLLTEKCAQADVVLDNSFSLERLRSQIDSAVFDKAKNFQSSYSSTAKIIVQRE